MKRKKKLHANICRDANFLQANNLVGFFCLSICIFIYLFLIRSCVHSPKHRNQIVLWHHQRDGTNFRYNEDFPDFKIESPVGFLPKGKYNGLAEKLDTNLHRIQSKVTLYCWQPLGAGKNCVLPNQFVSSCWMLLGVARWQISRHNFPEHVCYGASVRWFCIFPHRNITGEVNTTVKLCLVICLGLNEVRFNFLEVLWLCLWE